MIFGRGRLEGQGETPAHRRNRLRRFFTLAGLFVCVYLIAAYLLMPLAWEAFVDRHPSLDDNPRLTTTGDGHPGDPLNVALVGDAVDLKASMIAAGWYEANRLGLTSDLKIATDSVLGRAYDQAPVSRLFLYGRKEDFAFEKPVGNSPRQRHHVRFWRTPEDDASGRPVYVGSVTFDASIGISHTTGQITHHIGPDIDAERDGLIGDLEKAGRIERVDRIDGFQTEKEGRNGGGDPWRTDGNLWVGVLQPETECCAPKPPAATPGG